MAASATLRPAPGPLTRARRWLAGFKEPESLAAFAFLSPWIFGFVVFTAGPMVASAILSFTDYSVIQATHDVGFANYKALYNDPKVSQALRNTVIFTIMLVPAHVIVALWLATLLARVSRIAGFFRTVFYLPTMTPLVAVGVLYYFIFNGDYGLFNAFLGLFGIKGPYWTSDPTWIKPGLVLMQLWQVGGSVVILLAALMNVPQNLVEAAAIDGASAWRRFRDVTVPMISPAIFFIVIINTIGTLQTFDQVYTAYFNQNTPQGNDAALFYVIYLFQQAFQYFHLGYASALAWVLFGLIMAVTVVQIVVGRRFVYYEGQAR
ncbi:MAG TPA: sugar ABC transporter permease [Gaiellaceae bacterium]|nr:sugar ABC transporter permease [Gaiellaceae bacterium]